MTQKEFEERTGLKLSACEFESVHSIYMAAGDGMDKDVFCKEWKRHGESKLLANIWRELRRQEQVVEGKTIVIANMQQEKEELVDFLLERAQKFGDEELLLKAIDMVGHAEVIRRKLAADMPLWERDREYIKNNLK
jgi:hypothetical protein